MDKSYTTKASPWGQKVVRSFINFGLPLIASIEVDGFENVPRSGSYIAVANHQGRMDVPLVYYLLDRDDVIILVAEKYRQSAFWRWVVRQLDAMFIDRFNADFTVLRTTLQRLKRGDVLVLAPEGTRSPTGTLIEARSGASYLGSKAGVPMIPVGVVGTLDEHVLQQFKHLKRLNLHLRVGKPFFLPPVKGADREAVLQQYTDEIMCRIAALLPPELRGVYTDHPRLNEFLEE
jgi:1-acyl-sn-glycerol-3-phosphate acyltransferase